MDGPENVIPGKAKYYATAFPENGLAQGLIVESHLGRLTKVEGNPDHPASLGATCVHAQACMMDLYDPDRAKEAIYLGEIRTWEAFQIAWTAAAAGFRTSNGSRFRLLTETVVSPALADRIEALLKACPGAKWHQYGPAGRHSERAAAQMLFGNPLNTVVALDADFLASGPNSTRYAHDFANRRWQGSRLDMNRLYVVESTMTPTGGKADHRLALRYAEVETFACALADEVRGIEWKTPSPPPIHWN